MTDGYEPYEPPAERAGEPSAGRASPGGPQWPVLRGADGPVPPSAPTPRRSAARAGPAIVAVAAVVAIAVGGWTATRPDPADVRDQWERCLEKEHQRMSNEESQLEPEDVCSIRYPDAEEEYGDLGYDNPAREDGVTG